MLAEHGDEARVLAGGQSLMAMLNLRLADPAVLVDIARIAGARLIRDDRRPHRGRRRGHPEQAAGLAGAAEKLPLLAAGAAERRPLPDPQQGHGLRLDRACRPELGAAAVARAAGRRGGAALEPRHAHLSGRGFPARHADHRARSRDELIIAVRFPIAASAACVPRGGAAARRFRHHRGRARSIERRRRRGSASAAWPETPVVRRIPRIDSVTDAIERLA